MSVDLGALAFVTLAGLLTAIATGVGALPFFLVNDVSNRVTVILWGFASGIMVAASGFGLILEGLATGEVGLVAAGVIAGIILVIVAHEVIVSTDVDPRDYEEADFKKLVLILGILTVHSFPEGVAVGVSFAELGFENGLMIAGFSVPFLAVFMTIAISVHNVPEGLAISIPLRELGTSRWRMVGWAIFSSLPQPIGAALAFVFVRLAQQFLPFGFGFAAGAMVYLVLTEFIPEALEEGNTLPRNGYVELVGGFVAGVVTMLPFLLV